MRDRNDRYEGHQPEEEGEYHFSEDEVSYEVEPESPKATPRAGFKENFLNAITRSKRVLISLGVFFVLIFVVYKVVAPSSTPSTEIVSQAALPATPPTAIQASRAATPTVAIPAPPIMAANQPAMTPTASVAPSATLQQTATTPAAIEQGAQIPSVIPVQPPAPALPNREISNQPSTGAELRMATMVANNEKLMTQFQTDYTQKLADFAAQNKQLQDQLQLLSGRVASMETQMAQLMQALIRSNNTQINQPAAPPPPREAAPQPKISYNVQAIIPGRAWLRSDSGETLTVAEGDLIKEVGRVTKIDPYDGIVEINTGSKVISLSYGAGG